MLGISAIELLIILVILIIVFGVPIVAVVLLLKMRSSKDQNGRTDRIQPPPE